MALLECRKLNKKIGTYRLKDIDFTLEAGMVLGLIGVNGCGKTTLLRSVMGSYRLNLDPEDGGELFLNGKHFAKEEKAYRSAIAYVLENYPFSLNMNAREIGDRYGYYYPGFDLKKYKALLEKYEVPEKMVASRLSKGQKIRSQLAFALSYPAKLYILDEPAGNLDVEFRDAFYQEIRTLVADEECAVIISSHLVTELEQIADELLWIGRAGDEGTVRYFGSVDDMRDRYRLLSIDSKEEASIPDKLITGKRIRETHSEYLLQGTKEDFGQMLPVGLQGSLRYPSLQEIMYYTEKGGER